ncbi:MAG: hypothetical protein IKS80_03860 [Bacteroidaceae bacterium]|nr:hypothetical protein [Bacteroidaceae bacterium]
MLRPTRPMSAGASVRKAIYSSFFIFHFSFFLLLPLQASAAGWMSRLPDDSYVAVVSIPGAHDAATGSGWESGYADLGDSFARTQELNLAELWSIGVRAFDLRPCTREGYLNINHGIIPTVAHFDRALYLLRDSLLANPSEFVVIHLLHETDGDQVEGTYNQQLLDVLGKDGLKEFFVPFRRDLTVADLRGKMLLLSRDVYASKPVGGFIRGWSHSASWDSMTKGQITGTSTATLYMQDFFETYADGALDTKTNAMTRLLRFSTTHATTSASSIRWVMNFASAYSQVLSLFGYTVSSSDGYRDNAAHTHAAILDFLRDNAAGPTGIIFMDYAGVDKSNGFDTRGKELVEAIIANNFGYLDDMSGIRSPFYPSLPTAGRVGEAATPVAVYSLLGKRLPAPRQGELCLVRYSDGSVRKTIYR